MVWRAIVLAQVFLLITCISLAQTPGQGSDQRSRQPDAYDPGQLTIQRKDGSVGDLCPLKKTVVKADIAGFGAHVSVTQVFHNPSKEWIEAIYTFPLPNNAAVDHMTMHIGGRVIDGVIKESQIAQRIYEAAKNAGQAAALLDQERPNIFTQSVANIPPGAQVDIEIQYVQTLKFQNATFEFNFPMVVGPRFLGNAPDPGKISPLMTAKGTRTGTNIQLSVNIDAGAPLQDLKSVLHEVTTVKVDKQRYFVELKNEDEIPNRDFILRYRVAESAVTGAFVTHTEGDKGGFFGLALVPPANIAPADISPREFIFVMDQSGSQSGFPIEKSKELTLKLMDTLRPRDTFNVVGFANSAHSLWPSPRSNTAVNVVEAKKFVEGLQAGGGTQLREGLVAGLQGKPDPERLRIIVFNTDGYVGDEKLILDTLQKNRGNARVFTFGIGNGVNRYLIDSMSAEGRGAAEYVTLQEEAGAAVERFIQRTRTPVLTDISIKIDGAEVTNLEPAFLPDVFDQSPMYLFGRYQTPGKAKITITGKQGGKPWSKTMDVDLPMVSNHPQIMSLWARDRVDSLDRENYAGQFNNEGKNLKQAITDVALEFGIMSQYTSFVAVESRVINIGGKQRKVHVPVERVQGVDFGANVGDLPIQQSLGVPVGVGGGGGGLSPSNKVMKRIYTRSADPAFIYRQVRGSVAQNGVVPMIAGRSSLDEVHGHAMPPNPDDKIDASLRGAKGNVEIMVWLSDFTPATLKALTDAGVKVAEKDEKLKLVFATVDAAKLKEIAKLATVQRIEPLG